MKKYKLLYGADLDEQIELESIEESEAYEEALNMLGWTLVEMNEVKTYYCDSCPNYCKLETESNQPPANICIENGNSFDDDNSKGWYSID